MKVLAISGDKNMLTPGTEAYKRYELQKSAVDQLDVFGYEGVASGARGFFEVIQAVIETHYDVVTVQEPFWRGLLAWFAVRVSGARLNVQVHTDLSAQSVFRHALAFILLRHADSVRVVSEKIREQVQRTGTKASIHVLPVYVDVSRFQQVVPESHPQKTILWIGRFEREKDPLSAVRLLNEVRSKGLDAKLIMLGTGSLENAVRQQVGGLPVEFPGWEDPLQYLPVADVVVSTSKHESYGVSMIEALAARVPVVAPDIGIAKEAGVIVAPREKLADAVIEVLKSGRRGQLKLSMLNADEWARRWKETLV